MRSLVVLAVVVGSSTAALADEGDGLAVSTRVQDRSRVGLTLGAFTPTGEIGAEYTWTATPRLEVGFGAGVGGGWRPQAAIMPRVRWTIGHTTLALGAGLSGGEYSTYDGDFGFEYVHRTPVLWANGEASVLYGWDNGMFIRAAGGIGLAALHGATTNSGGEMKPFADYAMPYFGITAGHTL